MADPYRIVGALPPTIGPPRFRSIRHLLHGNDSARLISELQCLFISWAALACSHFQHVLSVRTLSAALA